MRRRRDPPAGAEGGPPARDGARDECGSPGGGARMQHRGNDGVSSHQPVGTLLPGCPDDETSCLRLRATLWDLRASVSRGSTGLPRGCLLAVPVHVMDGGDPWRRARSASTPECYAKPTASSPPIILNPTTS